MTDIVKQEARLAEFGGLTEEQERVIEYLANGVQIGKITKATGVKRKEIEKWLENDELFIGALSNARLTVARWSDMSLSQLAVPAIEKMWDIISSDYKSALPDERKEIARTARFILERTSAGDGSRGGVQNNLIVPGVYINNDSAEVIARHLSAIQAGQAATDEIEATYNVASVEETFACHPDTDYGALNYDEEEDTYQCHICGKWIRDIEDHARKSHGITYSDYKEVFRIA